MEIFLGVLSVFALFSAAFLSEALIRDKHHAVLMGISGVLLLLPVGGISGSIGMVLAFLIAGVIAFAFGKVFGILWVDAHWGDYHDSND